MCLCVHRLPDDCVWVLYVIDHGFQPFFTVDSLFAFLCFYKKSATMHTIYANSSHLIHIYYLCPHYVYITEHFSVDPMYSPLEIHLDHVGKLCYKLLFQ